jgi:hypothetical protein
LNKPEHYSLDDHPIFSKLSTIDRISLSAELASEFSATYIRGQIDGIWYAIETLKEIIKGSQTITEEQRQALYASAVVLAKAGYAFLEETQKGEASYLNDFGDES